MKTYLSIQTFPAISRYSRRRSAASAAFALIMAIIPGAGEADEVPTLRQVYAASESGHLVDAQEMMAKVLKSHPDSARAHYVEAVLDARQGNKIAGQAEFIEAEHLAPGLPFATPKSVEALRQQFRGLKKATIK